MEQKKILIVEDDPFISQIYFDTLVAEGYLVETAKDGLEAYPKIKQTQYDMILLDILMPNMNGFDLVEKLKAEGDQHITNTVILYLTNLDNEVDIKRALSLGKGYLIKSQITPEDLVREVKMYLQTNAAV